MDAFRLRQRIIRYLLLFLISVGLVAGFWFHGEFYALGLIPLLLVGGIATFLVLLALQWIATGRSVLRPPRATLELPKRAFGGDQLDGRATIAILPLEAAVPAAGSLAKVVLEGEGRSATMRVVDKRRCLAADLEESDAAAAGFDTLERFRERWAEGQENNDQEILVLVHFEPEVRG